MAEYLEFRTAKCKDCYKCLRECPVKAIDVKDHQAKIIEDRCILCGHCTCICPQNAKVVHSELPNVKQLLSGTEKVIASVAPSFISSFGLRDFSIFKIALAKLGFSDAEETAVGAQAVIQEYKRLLATNEYKNFITSACPAACRMIQEYFPKALKYLAPVDSPMIAHAKIIKKQHPNAKIVFLGPCIAKKREAAESDLIDGVLTFEDLKALFEERNIKLDEITDLKIAGANKGYANLAKMFPISHGIIKSFDILPDGYEYMAVDGPDRCVRALENIESLSNVFIEINICADACVNGPCSLEHHGGSIKAVSDVRNYVSRELAELPQTKNIIAPDVCLATGYPRIRNHSTPATEAQIEEILHKTGKFKPEDELNCGACGYATCREKAWAVANGYADIEICLPYMRERAESMSYEVIHNSPEGIIVLDRNMNVMDINAKACELMGITDLHFKGRPAVDFFNPVDFMMALNENRHVDVKKLFVPKTEKYVKLSINLLKGNEMLFGILQDVTDIVNYNEQMIKVKMDTLSITDDVIKKQMRVAQEIASLLGETTAETKVALLKLKKTLEKESKEDE